MSDDDRNTHVISGVSLKGNDEVVGFFAWERGLRGPCPIKYSATERQMYLSRKEWIEKTIGDAFPLKADEYALPLKDLAAKYPVKL